MRVFLIHGMGRSRASMLLLSSRLKRAGHRTSTFGYLVRTETLAAIGERWLAHLEEGLEKARAESGEDEVPYAIIGHSLGNIITRSVADRLPPGLSRLVMLAPPNQPPRLARELKDNPLYRALAGDCGQRLADPDFYDSLPIPEVPTLIVAGDAGGKGFLYPYRGAPSDGVVGVEETRLGERPHVVVNAVHTFIMNHRGAARTIHDFLEHGRLEPGEGAERARLTGPSNPA